MTRAILILIVALSASSIGRNTEAARRNVPLGMDIERQLLLAQRALMRGALKVVGELTAKRLIGVVAVARVTRALLIVREHQRRRR
jgi:hypothetical protein